MNLSPLSIFSLLALNLIISAINIIPRKTVKELFSDTFSDKIINLLKEINLFNKCNSIFLCFNGHTNRFTDPINLEFL